MLRQEDHFSPRLTCQNISLSIQKRTERDKDWSFTWITLHWKCSTQWIVLIPEVALDTVCSTFTIERYYLTMDSKMYNGPKLWKSSESPWIVWSVLKEYPPNPQPWWGPNTEEPASLRTRERALLKCLKVQEISDTGYCLWILFQDEWSHNIPIQKKP